RKTPIPHLLVLLLVRVSRPPRYRQEAGKPPLSVKEARVMGIKLKAPKWVIAGTAVAAVMALTAAGVVVSGVVGAGVPQPEDVMPANAMAFTKLDLNPSAGQKLAVFQLAAKFPKVKAKVTSTGTSIKESVFVSMFTGTGKDSLGLNYKKDVEPWLGDRIGVGVFPAFP